jgi:hypothetical protein
MLAHLIRLLATVGNRALLEQTTEAPMTELVPEASY